MAGQQAPSPWGGLNPALGARKQPSDCHVPIKFNYKHRSGPGGCGLLTPGIEFLGQWSSNSVCTRVPGGLARALPTAHCPPPAGQI